MNNLERKIRKIEPYFRRRYAPYIVLHHIFAAVHILDQMAPIKTIQIRANYAAWMSTSTKEFLKRRDLAQATASKTKNPEDWLAYKNLQIKGGVEEQTVYNELKSCYT